MAVQANQEKPHGRVIRERDVFHRQARAPHLLALPDCRPFRRRRRDRNPTRYDHRPTVRWRGPGPDDGQEHGSGAVADECHGPGPVRQ